ncbi:hypothetical protein LNP74_33500 [Klebsiella pneumoniae subsp. pneumoniae]|nr:hypothetical protein [Klebsiella pneumoniae subsp. pneumoniae]
MLWGARVAYDFGPQMARSEPGVRCEKHLRPGTTSSRSYDDNNKRHLRRPAAHAYMQGSLRFLMFNARLAGLSAGM